MRKKLLSVLIALVFILTFTGMSEAQDSFSLPIIVIIPGDANMIEEETAVGNTELIQQEDVQEEAKDNVVEELDTTGLLLLAEAIPDNTIVRTIYSR